MSIGLPSRFDIGDKVLFNPRAAIDEIMFERGETLLAPTGYRAMVIKVNFRPGKVTYDLAMLSNGPSDTLQYYDILPICDVDSVYVTPAPVLEKEYQATSEVPEDEWDAMIEEGLEENVTASLAKSHAMLMAAAGIRPRRLLG